MNTDDVRFASARTLAPSLEVVSSVLGQTPEQVTRRAEVMRAVGVPLEELGHTLEGRDHTNDS